MRMMVKNKSVPILVFTLMLPITAWATESVTVLNTQKAHPGLAEQGGEIFATSFDCDKANNTLTEKTICTNRVLAKLDIKLSEIYHSFYFLSKEIKSDQRAWLKKRNTCKDDKCIKKAYLARLEVLKLALSNQRTFPQFILRAMKKAEKNMQPEWVKFPPVFPDDEKYKQQGVEFKSELFRFQHLRFKSPLVENVPYDDKRLKAVLGACAKYSFDRYVASIGYNYTTKGYQDYYFKYDIGGRGQADFYAHRGFTVWQVTAQGKQWLLIKAVKDSSEIGSSPYLVRPDLCQQDATHDLLAALTKGTIKKSLAGLKSLRVVEYKNEDYLFETYLYPLPHSRVGFHVNQILTSNMVVGRKLPYGVGPARQEKYRRKDGWLYDLWFFLNK